WRQLLRSLLREASYLPDPVAKVYMQCHVLDRFRKYADNARFRRQEDLWRRWQLQKQASKSLSLLQRANEGYPKPLEKVLRMAYGRSGTRRLELVRDLIAGHTPSSETPPKSLQDLLDKKLLTEDWKPPPIIVELVNAQQVNSMIPHLNGALKIKKFERIIPKQNSWARPVPNCRRRNIRRDWYRKVLSNCLPPLPHDDLEILEGLISGRLPWTPPKRRKAIGAAPAPTSETNLDVEFLVDGPKKGPTFRPYTDGRPHVLTRRFMVRTWMRISALIPRLSMVTKIHPKTGVETRKPCFAWDWSPPAKVALPVREDMAADIFEGVDSQGRLL
ncbi:uncharacterized protein BO97DRAFT_326527, partial [Aspergillus homomorphus CBS 101889]